MCATCREPHNANNVADLPMNVFADRLIRNIPKPLTVGERSSKSIDEDEEDDYSLGLCSTHNKSVLYFFCKSHSLKICRECTVLEHQPNRCDVVSLKKEIEKKKECNIQQASSTATAINETVSALGEIVKEKNNIILNQENKILQWKKDIEDAINTISKEKIVTQKAEREISEGKIRTQHIESARQNLQKAKTKITISSSNKDIETVATNITTWIQDVQKQFDLPHKKDYKQQNTTLWANFFVPW
ncbi:unnamed protein product [Meganyctiphanes norvegica]|uniref:B box-type domain-containing protein n=1 Tax=Meganyctiphanes norvegica TaxID=48144 RepID=A0AAV2R9N7_MEGNR